MEKITITTRAHLFLALLLLVSNIAYSQDPTSPDSPSLAIAATFTQYAEAINTGNYSAAAAIYSNRADFLWVEDGAVRYESAQEAGASLASLADYGGVQFAFTTPRIVLLDNDVASLFTEHTTTIGSGNTAFTFSGAMTIIFVLEEDAWRIAGGHTSSPQ